MTLSPSTLLDHFAVLLSPLAPFLSLPDAVRLLATCRVVRNDRETAVRLLNNFPLVDFVMQCSFISKLGCTPRSNPRPLQIASWPSALSTAALLERDLLPQCYQWHHGRHYSTKLEPFVLPLASSVEDSVESIQHTLALEGLHCIVVNAASLAGYCEAPTDRFHWDDTEITFTDSESDSEWESDSDDEDEDIGDCRPFAGPDIAMKQSRTQHVEVTPASVRKLLATLRGFGFRSVCQLRIVTPPLTTCGLGYHPQGETRQLLLGLSPSRTVIAGGFVRTKSI